MQAEAATAKVGDAQVISRKGQPLLFFPPKLAVGTAMRAEPPIVS